MEHSTPLFEDNAFSTGLNVVLFTFGTVLVLFFMIFLVINIVAMWKLFAKAGEPGWKSLIPIYNSWIFLRLGDQPGWWAVAGLIPPLGIVTLILSIIAAHRIGLKLSKPDWWVILYIFVQPIWMLVLAFDKSTWNDTKTNPTPPPLPGEKPAFVPPAAKSEQPTPPLERQ